MRTFSDERKPECFPRRPTLRLAGGSFLNRKDMMKESPGGYWGRVVQRAEVYTYKLSVISSWILCNVGLLELNV